MRKFTCFLVGTLGGLLLLACQRGVNAGGEEDYKPRPAPVQKTPEISQVKGKLVRVHLKDKTVAVRVENGMIETFDFDDDTTVSGLETGNNSEMGSLVGKEGSKVIVKWGAHDGTRIASSIEVTRIVTSRTRRHLHPWQRIKAV
jgi:hypothetical protein